MIHIKVKYKLTHIHLVVQKRTGLGRKERLNVYKTIEIHKVHNLLLNTRNITNQSVIEAKLPGDLVNCGLLPS